MPMVPADRQLHLIVLRGLVLIDLITGQANTTNLALSLFELQWLCLEVEVEVEVAVEVMIVASLLQKLKTNFHLAR